MADAKAKPANTKPKGKSISKTELLKTIAESTEVDKKTVAVILDSLTEIVTKNLGKKGPGVVALPGLVKIKVVHKEAQPARKGVMMMGRLTDIPAKPARKVVKVQPLKALKDAVI